MPTVGLSKQRSERDPIISPPLSKQGGWLAPVLAQEAETAVANRSGNVEVICAEEEIRRTASSSRRVREGGSDLGSAVAIRGVTASPPQAHFDQTENPFKTFSPSPLRSVPEQSLSVLDQDGKCSLSPPRVRPSCSPRATISPSNQVQSFNSTRRRDSASPLSDHTKEKQPSPPLHLPSVVTPIKLNSHLPHLLGDRNHQIGQDLIINSASETDEDISRELSSILTNGGLAGPRRVNGGVTPLHSFHPLAGTPGHTRSRRCLETTSPFSSQPLTEDTPSSEQSDSRQELQALVPGERRPKGNVAWHTMRGGEAPSLCSGGDPASSCEPSLRSPLDSDSAVAAPLRSERRGFSRCRRPATASRGTAP